MSETQTAVVPATGNPFDPESFVHGGGLWDGKTVTITSAKAKTEALKYGDGKPVVDAKTGEQSIQTALYITGIADGGDDKERHEEYSVGDKLAPTPDGEGFTMKDGSPAKFHANSNIAKFSAALRASGFDLSALVVDGRQKLSKLTGARFVFKAEAKLGKDGKAVKDKKGYDKNIHLPAKFVGYAVGVVGGSAAVAAGSDATSAKATDKVLAVLAGAGGKITRADLVRNLATTLAGDPDANAIITLSVLDSFHVGKPWKFDGSSLSL